MSDSIERFQKRRQALREAAAKPRLVLLPPPEVVAGLQLGPEDLAYVNAPRAADRFEPPAAEHDIAANAQALLAELADNYDQRKFAAMLSDVRAMVFSTVAGAFGAGKLVSLLDRDGGNVDTVHNARNGVHASDQERQRFEQRAAYDTDAVHKHARYTKTNAAIARQRDAGTLTDAYTGNTFSPSDKKDSQLKPTLDHIVAAKNVHDDAGRVLAGLDTADLANIAPNLAPTACTVNSTKKAHRAAKVAQKLAQDAPKRKARIKELEENQSSWGDKERKEYKKLKTQDSIDPQRLAQKEKEAQAAITAEINKAYYTSGKFARATAVAAASEGARMGVQQALGIVVVEFLAAAMDEIQALYRHGLEHESLVAETKVRLNRVAARVVGKWKPVLAGLRDGFLSGLLSSIVTTLVNTFLTTGKRLVRMIREGILSLLRAVKLLVVRPKGMTKRQAMHEASKVLVGTAILVGGIAVEEFISKQLMVVPGIGLVADAAGAAIAGVLTALATGFAVYLLDRADVFNVNGLERQRAIGEELDRRLRAPIEAASPSLDAGAPPLPG